MGEEHLDEQLFIRGGKPPRWLCKAPADQDERFSTPGDLLFARIIAKEQVVKYLENAIQGA